jgi:hypothetical protein
MAGRSKTPQPQSADLTPERMRQGIKRLEAALQQVMAFDPDINSKDETSKADRLSAAIEAALTQTFGHGTIEFNRYNDAAHFSWPLNYAFEVPLHEIQGSLRRCKNHSAEMLQEAIVFLRNELDLSSDEISTGSTRAAFPAKKPVGSNVVIGHGGSALWHELKDFLRDRLNLPVDEFNAVTVAGLPTVERLEGMLNGARFAFLVMTAEDEQPDGKVRARENVVHEVGLFQGKLGFRKAIILLEDGCEEFSNIHGLGQIRFQRENLAAKFEEVRKVLEREGVI